MFADDIAGLACGDSLPNLFWFVNEIKKLQDGSVPTKWPAMWARQNLLYFILVANTLTLT
jgi:hypothetical protein